MAQENFRTWTRTVTGLVAEDGTAYEFDGRVNEAFEHLRNECEVGKWIPTGVNNNFSTQTNGTDVICVMVITAQLVSQAYAESQQRAQMIQQNGFRR